MKKLLLLVLAFLLILLAACTAEPAMTVTTLPHKTAPPAARSVLPSVPPGVSPAVISSAVPSPAPRAADVPPSKIPDTDIPDILKSTNETVVNSNYTLYEDGKYIYYLNQYVSDRYLFRIDRQTGNAVRISDKDCGCFTISKGIVYYTEYSGSHDDWGLYNVIKSYDPLTNKKETVIKVNNWIVSMASYGNKLYSSYYPVDPDASEESAGSVSNLYVMDPDSAETNMIKTNVSTFSIYKDVIYYTGDDYPDGAPLRKCGIDGSDAEELIEVIDGYFDIGGNRLFYDSGYIDLGSGESTDMDYDLYAPFGQYLIYCDRTWDGNKNTYYFHSYDPESGKTADLTHIGDIDEQSICGLHSTEDNVYFSVPIADGSFKLYRLVIENGKAGMEMVSRQGA